MPMHLENSISGNYSVVKAQKDYADWSLDLNITGIAFINASTNSSIFSSDNSTVSESIVLNI